MAQPEFLTELNDENIVQFQPRNLPELAPNTMKFGRFRKAFEAAITSEYVNGKINLALDSVETYTYHYDDSGSHIQYWFQDGIDCEMLKLGDAQWRRGKLRMQVSLEFVPDELPQASEDSDESPLAEIRQEIAANSLDT